MGFTQEVRGTQKFFPAAEGMGQQAIQSGMRDPVAIKKQARLRPFEEADGQGWAGIIGSIRFKRQVKMYHVELDNKQRMPLRIRTLGGVTEEALNSESFRLFIQDRPPGGSPEDWKTLHSIELPLLVFVQIGKMAEEALKHKAMQKFLKPDQPEWGWKDGKFEDE